MSAKCNICAMALTIDKREHQAIACLGAMTTGVEYNTAILDVGDFQIKCDEFTVIFERKTVHDLLSSLKDNRYREQKIRLMNQRMKGDRIILIVEGKTDMHDPIQLGCYLSMQVRDEILTMFTNDLQETVLYILGAAIRVRNDPLKFSVPRPLTQDEYVDTGIRAHKKHNSTKQSVFLNQICAIPGISVKKARIIAAGTHSKCMSDLILFMQTDVLSAKCQGIGEKLQLAVSEHLL